VVTAHFQVLFSSCVCLNMCYGFFSFTFFLWLSTLRVLVFCVSVKWMNLCSVVVCCIFLKFQCGQREVVRSGVYLFVGFFLSCHFRFGIDFSVPCSSCFVFRSEIFCCDLFLVFLKWFIYVLFFPFGNLGPVTGVWGWVDSKSQILLLGTRTMRHVGP